MVHFTADYTVITAKLVTALSIKITTSLNTETTKTAQKELGAIKIYILSFFITFQSSKKH